MGGGAKIHQLKPGLVTIMRWTMYKEFIDAHEEYEQIFVTDVRDVIFQDDIFAKYVEHKDALIYADESKLISEVPININWIRKVFGDTEYQKIADNIIICCGTVYGARAEMQIFLSQMVEVLKRTTADGEDQPTMNYLVYNNLLPIENIVESKFENGELFTVGIAENIEIRDDKILRGDGGIPAVVHQYDRHAAMTQLVDRLYREKDFQPDESFSDARSSLDQTLCLTFRQKFIDATKIFIGNVFYADLNKFGDSYLKIWQMILQAPTPNFDTETLSVAVQSKIPAAFSANFNINQMENIYAAYAFCEKTRRAINPALRNFVANMTLRFVEIFQQNGRMDLSLKYLERAARMNMLAALNAT